MMNMTPEQAKSAESMALELATRMVAGCRAFETFAVMKGITSNDVELMEEANKMQGALTTCFARDPSAHRTAMITAVAMMMSAKSMVQQDMMEMGPYTLEEVAARMFARMRELDRGGPYHDRV